MSLATPYGTSELISLIKNLEALPISQNTFTEANLCQLLNYTLQNDITPLILKTNEEYFVDYEDFDVDANTEYLEIPRIAVGMRARDVQWRVQGSGQPQNWVSLTRIHPEVVGGNQFPLNGPYVGGAGYMLRGNRIIFVPQIQSGGTVRILFFRRPNILVTQDLGASIVSIDTNANTVDLDTINGDWVVGSYVDVIHDYQPFTFAAYRAQIVDITGLTVEFAPAVIADLAVGDVVTTTGTSIFPQYVPIEAHGVLAQGAALKCLQSLNDKDGIKVAAAQYAEQKQALLDMITPRVQGQPNKIGSTGRGLGSVGGYGRWGFNGAG